MAKHWDEMDGGEYLWIVCSCQPSACALPKAGDPCLPYASIFFCPQPNRRFVKPSFDAFCFPQRSHADVILPRGADNAVAVALLVEAMRTMLADYSKEMAT